MNFIIRIITVTIVVIVSDIYFFRAIKALFVKDNLKQKRLKIILIIMTLIFAAFEASWFLIIGNPGDDPIKYRQLYMLLNIFILLYLPKAAMAIPLIIYDLYRFVVLLINKTKVSGLKFKNYLWVLVMSLFIYAATLAFCINGFTFSKTNIKLQNIKLCFSDLPEEFNGFKIIQISDLHLGSYKDTCFISKATRIIKDLSPDMLLMTGDMINVSDVETENYVNIFSDLKFPYGKFCILGNHDIGDYFKLREINNQAEITNKLVEAEKKMGFVVLIDSACYIKKGKDSIALAGVNNIGNYPFKRTGDLNKALSYTKNNDFVILMSHDPNHWKDEVSGGTNISLTLSGHTHAMQLACVTDMFKFSPSRFIFKYWYGEYALGKQVLYVNPGLGYSGFSARIGIRPEITIITLNKKG